MIIHVGMILQLKLVLDKMRIHQIKPQWITHNYTDTQVILAEILQKLLIIALEIKIGIQSGNGSTWATTAGTAANVLVYVNKRYFPRNTASLIENLEIKINGQSRQNINQYGYIYNILNDYMCGYDTTAKNRIGSNADPSNKSTFNYGQLQRYVGFPVGCTSQSVDNSHLDQDWYSG